MLTLLPFVGIALLFWLLLIRPTSRRQKELRGMQDSLSVQDEVVLTSGVYGTVTELADDHLLLQIADGVEIKVVRAAVGNVVRPEPADDEDTEDLETNDESGATAGPEEN